MSHWIAGDDLVDVVRVVDVRMRRGAIFPAEHRQAWSRVVDRLIVQGIIKPGDFGAVGYADGFIDHKRYFVMEFSHGNAPDRFIYVDAGDIPPTGYEPWKDLRKPAKLPRGGRHVTLNWSIPLPEHVSWDPPK